MATISALPLRHAARTASLRQAGGQPAWLHALAHLLKNRRVSLLSLRAFVALMRYRHTGRAAAELGIQSQRLHYQLRSLESALDTELFRVCSPHWLPTPAAIRMLPRAQRVLAMWRDILDSLAQEPATPASVMPPYGPVAFWVRQATM
ncbi:hypothetical protein AWV79_22785 [Cupriavidus sp. UYMMa02A]|nr:hypothetical protein AWV79_22785 [Cupriavidus sp. UYMMa02A]